MTLRKIKLTMAMGLCLTCVFAMTCIFNNEIAAFPVNRSACNYHICYTSNRLPPANKSFCPVFPQDCDGCKEGHIMESDGRICFELEITEQPAQNITEPAGSTVTLSCVFNGDVLATWHRNGHDIVIDGRYSWANDNNSSTTRQDWSLIITNLSDSDAVDWVCSTTATPSSNIYLKSQHAIIRIAATTSTTTERSLTSTETTSEGRLTTNATDTTTKVDVTATSEFGTYKYMAIFAVVGICILVAILCFVYRKQIAKGLRKLRRKNKYTTADSKTDNSNVIYLKKINNQDRMVHHPLMKDERL